MADETKNKDAIGTAAEATEKRVEKKADKSNLETTTKLVTVDKSDEAKEFEYKTTGNFQLYDVTTGTLFPAKGTAKAMDNNTFVVHHVARGNLKKA